MADSFFERLRLVLPGVWVGALLAIALIAAPATFAALPPAEAGRINGRMFVIEAWVSIVLALLLWLIERRRAGQASAQGTGSIFSAEMVMLAGVLLCTFAGYFGVQQLLPAARAGQGPIGFAALHAASVGFYGLKTLLLLALAWRSAGR